jgi:hypothetical protein
MLGMEALLLGLLALLVGAAFCFIGYRFFLVLLPIWGFLVGLAAGVNGMAALFGQSFLSSATGIVVGLVIGIVFAVLSYLFWYVAVAVLGGTVGYAIGGGVLAAIGIDPGFLTFLAGIALGAVFVVGILILNIPKFAILLLTAAGGAGAIVLGVALIIGRVKVESLGEGGILGGVLQDSVLWTLAWVVLTVVGYAVQLQSTRRFEIEVERYRFGGTPGRA